MKNYKQLIITTGLMMGLAIGIVSATHCNVKQTIRTEFEKYSIGQELKSVYSEYNMLIKNKAHGAKVPQSRLDKLQYKAKILRAELNSLETQ